mmetsp:Transcript_34601/g.75793  ORF Transcript_34601/g.75793 Transcript_34601/m.75793 type:complete len:117 (+) Transcript_34601:245-595(+)
MLSHTLQFALLLTLLTNLIHHLWVKAASRKEELSHWERYGAVYLVTVASIMMMLQPTLYVFKDIGCPASCVLRDHPIMLSVITHTGYILLLIGICLATDLVDNLRAKMGSSRPAEA